MKELNKITTLVTVTKEDIKNMIYLASLNKDDYNLSNPTHVSSIIETFIERTLEAYL